MAEAHIPQTKVAANFCYTRNTKVVYTVVPFVPALTEQLTAFAERVQSEPDCPSELLVLTRADEVVQVLEAAGITTLPFDAGESGLSTSPQLLSKARGRYILFTPGTRFFDWAPIRAATQLLQSQKGHAAVFGQCAPNSDGSFAMQLASQPLPPLGELNIPSDFFVEDEGCDGRRGPHHQTHFILYEQPYLQERVLDDLIATRTSLVERLPEAAPDIATEQARLLLKNTRHRGLAVTPSPVEPQRAFSFYQPQTTLAPSSRRLNICIVTLEIEGPFRNGGIGTAYTALAETLARAPHNVTVLYCGENISEKPFEHWIAHYESRGIKLVPLPAARYPVWDSPGRWLSYRVLQWLSDHHFDFLHFHELGGLAYYPLVAKRQGLALHDTLCCVSLHSPLEWIREASCQLSEYEQELENSFMERESAALADLVISPSRYMLQWVQEAGWSLPANAWTLPNICPVDHDEPDRGGRGRIKEIVFFGRLETRKGVKVFCDALDRLNNQPVPPFYVTFMGKAAEMSPGVPTDQYIQERSSHWMFPVKLLTGYNQSQALAYLRASNRFAVVPSLTENSPYTVLECLRLQIPFIAAAVGGIPELIAPADRDRVLFAPEPASLSDKLSDILRKGVAPAMPSTRLEKIEQRWLALHDEYGRTVPPSPRDRASVPQHMLVSVCVAHKDRPALLAQALQSLRQQTFREFEVIVVDDGSDKPETRQYLANLESEYADLRLRLIRQENRYLGAARNTAAMHARGQYLLFMDDDNVAKASELETLVRVAGRGTADILCPMNDRFRGSAYPKEDLVPFEHYLPLGGAAHVGFFQNCYGDANFFIRRDVFLKLGGFWESVNVGYEDWQFLAHAGLSGCRIQPIPLPLYWYRVMGSGMLMTAKAYQSLQTVFLPFYNRVPNGLHPALAFAASLNKRRKQEMGQSFGAQEALDALFARAKVILRVSAENGFAGVDGYQMMTRRTGSSLEIEALTDDPILLLPVFQYPERGRLIVRVEIASSIDTTCEMFHLPSPSIEYGWPNVVTMPLRKGFNIIMMEIKELPIFGRLRLDPGSARGAYELWSVEVGHL